MPSPIGVFTLPATASVLCTARHEPLVWELTNGEPVVVTKGQVPPDELAAYALEELGNGFLTIFWLSQHAFDGV
jgi:hypothetical protein